MVDVLAPDRPRMKVIVPIWAAQQTTATSVGQISSAWRPEGNWIRAVST
jgi:hypothetical protein